MVSCEIQKILKITPAELQVTRDMVNSAANTSGGCVSKLWPPSAIQGCALRVQKCTVGCSQELSSKVPARTARNSPGCTDPPGIGPHLPLHDLYN
jgi:hypothetical protein